MESRVWLFGDDVNTDVIFPGKYTYTITDPKEMAQHAMEDANERFAREVKAGDVIVAGRNFGCGSSREQAVKCLKAAGVAAILAGSIARIYFRNAINEGLPVAVVPGLSDSVDTGDHIQIDFSAGTVITETETFSFTPLTGPARDILETGGLIPYVRDKLTKKKQQEEI